MSLTKNLYILIIVQLISFWATNTAYAQKKTELDSVKIKAYAEDGSYIGSPNDSSIYKFHQYNPALSGNNFYAYGGNIGLSARNIEFVLPDFGFTGLKNNFAIWDFSNQPIGYYNTTRPFTNAQVVFGSKRELVSRVFHTQNVNPYTNIGVEIKSLQSEGFATRQQTNILNSRLFFAYQPTSIRYNVQANWDWGRVANQENAGVNSDSSFQYLVEADPRLVPTYLPNSITNKVGGNFTTFQYLNLGEKTKETIDSVAVTKIKAESRFFHRFSYSDYTNLYSDVFTNPILDVYKNYYFDSLLTRDEIQTIQVTNELGWDNSARYQKDSSAFFLKLSLAHAYVDYQQREVNKFYDNVWINAQIKKRLGIKNELFLNSSFMAAGYNSSDYRIFAGIRNNNDSSKINYRVTVFSQLQHPDQIVNEYSSNHFRWINIFKQQLYNGVSGFIQYKKQSAEINYYTVSNFIYFDQYATPAQYGSSVQVVSAKLNSDFKLGKIYFSNVVLVQKSLAGTSVTRLPLLCSRHTIYFQKILFKKTTPFQGGVEINYNSAYMANAYMPSSNQFYLQNKQRIGNYAVLDVFLSFRIRSAKVFVKSEHVNNMLLAGNYFLVPFHPMHDRSFKVGVSWSFVN